MAGLLGLLGLLAAIVWGAFFYSGAALLFSRSEALGEIVFGRPTVRVLCHYVTATGSYAISLGSFMAEAEKDQYCPRWQKIPGL